MRRVRWRHLEDGSHEELALDVGAKSVHATGTVLAPSGTEALRYRVECDAAWRVRSVEAFQAGDSVSLASDGRGHWATPDGNPVEALEGCIDVDLQGTPFTNTIPIRRLDLREGESRTLRVAYVPLPSLRPLAVPQTYTCLRRGSLYRYEGYPRGFVADLAVDGDGLVVAYPKLFQRL